eukprot:CAMPEP_0202708340 /NCGR_PEP_ID=MMETSP1385-20130828/20571_1 /ASSEMBLY_ACC=CAM_ASM_000861 /TAXON_ID=933848 /ORGANISM="Elphidium margaritaceum" /LENGTH=645 /DNA_ID=CAMNT_0049367293 /DNA_START=41 /DNA_END=1978 /DNA_ORIENTATION=-
MAHPGIPRHHVNAQPQSLHDMHAVPAHHSVHDHDTYVYEKKNKGDVYETKNFDTIDYIVQIPVIDKPKKRQSRFLLAMEYRLQPRHGLGLMDTALEHLVHYYDMKNIQLIFCEQWNSVCIFIEFHNVEACRRAYDQLHQFFKTRFYVEDMAGVRKLWICDQCQCHNLAEEKRDDDDILCCRQCDHVTMRRLKKIKYLYQRVPSSLHHNRASTDPSYQRGIDHYNQQQQHKQKQNRKSRAKIGANRFVSSDEQLPQMNPQKRMNGPPLQIELKNAKSQTVPLSATSSIYAQMKHFTDLNNNHNHNPNYNRRNSLLDDDEEDDGLLFPGGTFGNVDDDDGTHVVDAFDSDMKVCSGSLSEGDKNAAVLRTPGSNGMVMGQASGLLTFKLPAQWRSGGPANGMVPSKSMNDMASQTPLKPALRFHSSHGSHIGSAHQHPPHHQKNASNVSTLTGVSSPEVMSPSSVATMTPGSMMMPVAHTSLTEHGKKHSVDSQASQVSTTSTVSSIDTNLELCCQILENVEHESCALDLNVLGGADESLHMLEIQKQNVRRKILKLSRVLKKLEATFNASTEQFDSSELLDMKLHTLGEGGGGDGGGVLQSMPIDDDKSAADDDDNQDFDVQTSGDVIIGQAASNAVQFNYPAVKH